jgi:hypothetical protein
MQLRRSPRVNSAGWLTAFGWSGGVGGPHSGSEAEDSHGVAMSVAQRQQSNSLFDASFAAKGTPS